MLLCCERLGFLKFVKVFLECLCKWTDVRRACFRSEMGEVRCHLIQKCSNKY